MNAEFVKTIYTWAVIALAAIAVWHLVNHGQKKGCNRNPGPTPAMQIDPTWWRPGPVIGPRAATRKTRMTLAGL